VVALAAIVVAAVIGRVRDSGSSQPTAAEWADSVCGDLATWKTSITSIASVSGGTLTKESLQQKLGDAQKATNDLVSELKGLGAPDLESGDQLQQQLDTSADALNASYEELTAQAQDALNADSPTAFLQGLAKLAPEFQKLLDQIETTVSDLRDANVAASAKAELQQAFDDASSCQSLKSGNG
jgi:outer membrane protein OmpA-like peptidoglycan-associated protein